MYCDCYEKEAEKNIQRMKGCVIEDSVVVNDPCFTYMFQKLKPTEGPVFYLRICIKDGGGEYACWRRVLEVTEEEFLNCQDVFKCNEDTQTTDEDEEYEVDEMDCQPVLNVTTEGIKA